jgi:hypothetical protein
MKLHVRRSSLSSLVLPLVACASLACSSSGSSTSTTEDSGTSVPIDSSVPTTTPDAATLTPDAGPATDDAGSPSFNTDIYGAIIEHHCIGCHGFEADGGAGPGIAFGKLDFSSVDAGYANLVNVPAAGAACGETDGATAAIRVVPGSAATSLLYEKVNGFTTAPPCGGPMPKSGEIPDGGQAVVVAQIQAWINGGALP